MPQLDSPDRWDRELNEDELHALALARVITHKAPWVLIDEILDSLDDAWLERAIDIFTKDLAQSAIIYIGRTDAHHVFSRVLHLIMDPTAKKLKALGAAPAAPAAAPALAATSEDNHEKTWSKPCRTGGIARRGIARSRAAADLRLFLGGGASGERSRAGSLQDQRRYRRMIWWRPGVQDSA